MVLSIASRSVRTLSSRFPSASRDSPSTKNRRWNTSYRQLTLRRWIARTAFWREGTPPAFFLRLSGRPALSRAGAALAFSTAPASFSSTVALSRGFSPGTSSTVFSSNMPADMRSVGDSFTTLAPARSDARSSCRPRVSTTGRLTTFIPKISSYRACCSGVHFTSPVIVPPPALRAQPRSGSGLHFAHLPSSSLYSYRGPHPKKARGGPRKFYDKSRSRGRPHGASRAGPFRPRPSRLVWATALCPRFINDEFSCPIALFSSVRCGPTSIQFIASVPAGASSTSAKGSGTVDVAVPAKDSLRSRPNTMRRRASC